MEAEVLGYWMRPKWSRKRVSEQLKSYSHANFQLIVCSFCMSLLLVFLAGKHRRVTNLAFSCIRSVSNKRQIQNADSKGLCLFWALLHTRHNGTSTHHHTVQSSERRSRENAENGVYLLTFWARHQILLSFRLPALFHQTGRAPSWRSSDLSSLVRTKDFQIKAKETNNVW